MNHLLLLIFCYGALLGVGRGLDLALWTDPATGLCTAGSVWWRYLALGVGVLLSLGVGWRAAGSPGALLRRRPLPGVLALAGTVCFGAAGVLRLSGGVLGVRVLVRAALEVLCALWLAALGSSWLRRGSWKPPAGGLTGGVLGTAVLYWCILMRFMENSSSWHRAGPTAQVWVLMAAVSFLAALLRALYLPGTESPRTLCSGALAAFLLGLCWGLPEALALAGAGAPAEMAFWLGVCCVGALGICCAAMDMDKTL